MEKYYEIPNEADQELRTSSRKQNIITFNGQGRSGKTTLAKQLVEEKSCSSTKNYRYVLSHTLRDEFLKKFYRRLARSDQQLQQEVIGIPSLAWLTADFHWKIKPLLLKDYIIVFDHYIADFYADMLPNGTAESFQHYVRKNLAIPHFSHGKHFYLDINYETYLKRGNERKGTEWFSVGSEDLFEERRSRYKELCDLKYLICIDATACKNTVLEQIQEGLKSESRY